jgi:hypothetical protein
MHSPLDIRNIRCLDGLHYSFELLEHFYESLHKDCCEIPKDNSKVIPVLASCWGFIDTLHRIREIAQSIPGLSDKHPEMRAFLSATALAETYRHYIQHLRQELAKDPPNTFPVWGSLSWVDDKKPERSYMAMFGAQLSATSYTGSVFDTVNKKWVSNVCLGVKDYSFNFDPIYEACTRFKKFVLPYLFDGASGQVKFHEKLPILAIDAPVIPPSPPPPNV